MNGLVRILIGWWGGLQKMLEVAIRTIYSLDTVVIHCLTVGCILRNALFGDFILQTS